MAVFASAVIGLLSGAASSVGSALGLTGPTNLVAGTAAAGASTGSTFASILQGGLGLVGAMGAVRAGQSNADTYKMQAADTRAGVTQEQIDQTNRDTSMRKALLQSIGERDTAYAASGVDLSFGTPVTARAQAVQDANAAITQGGQASATRQAQGRAKASTLDALASDAEQSGWIKAGGSLLSTGVDILKRG